MAAINTNGLLNLPGLPGITSPGEAPGKAPVSGGFADVFRQAFQQVNEAQITAGQLNEQLATGQVQDVAQVMIATEKANLSLQMAVQVRNKLLEAYQEIMRMQV